MQESEREKSRRAADIRWASAFELVHVRCPDENSASLRFAEQPSASTGTPSMRTAINVDEYKQRVIQFLSTQYADVDFIEEKVHWLSVANCFGPGRSP
jgi:hypothetical protein